MSRFLASLPTPLISLLPTLSGLSACSDPVLDSADTAEPVGQVDLAVGEVADMAVESDRLWAEVAQPGTYVAILVSTAEEQGTTYGYGNAAGAGKRMYPSDPAPPPRPPPQPHRSVAEGDTREFVVYNGNTTVTVEAEAIRVTDTIVVWEDITTPNESGEVEEDTLDTILEDFAEIAAPRVEQVFGETSDVDADGRLAVLLSYTVNQYGAEAYVTWCDIGITDDCGGYGNDAEVIYLAWPDTDDGRSSANGYVETMAHELNHLIYAHHKYVLNGHTAASENVYVTEGMSALAQDLSGYNNGNQYVWAAALDMSEYYGSEDYSIQAVSANDMLRGATYYDDARDGALRGGAYLLFRYLFEQAGGMTVESDGSLQDAGGMAWLQEYFDLDETGVTALETMTGRDLSDVLMDWYTALVVSGRGLNSDPVYNYQDRVEDPLTGYSFGIDPFDTIHGWLELTGPLVQDWEEPDGVLRAGGVEYLQGTLDAGLVEIPVDEGAAARARLFRVE